MQKFPILGIEFAALNLKEAADNVESILEEGRSGYVCVCPVSTIMAAQDDASVKHIVNSADVVTTDGMPSVWIGRSRGYQNTGRVYGPDLMLELCRRSQKQGFRHFFYGSTPDVLEKLREKLIHDFPKIKICGMYSPPFGPITPEDDEAIVRKIREADPHYLWVGLGSPKQDIWIYEHKERIGPCVALAVGAAFDFIAGTKPQAPRWMQKSGLEWLFRLCCEPKRLWRRYVIGNTRFLFLLFKENLSKTTR